MADTLLRQIVNKRVSFLRKSYRKARWKKRYARWYKDETEMPWWMI